MLSDMSFFSCSRVTFRARLLCVYLQFLTDACSCSHSPSCTDFLCSARCSFYVTRYSHSVQGYLTSLIVFRHFVIAAKSLSQSSHELHLDAPLLYYFCKIFIYKHCTPVLPSSITSVQCTMYKLTLVFCNKSCNVCFCLLFHLTQPLHSVFRDDLLWATSTLLPQSALTDFNCESNVRVQLQ